MDETSLSPDCARCAALCCVSLAFDRSASFAIDKPNGVVCPNLADDNLCRIHADRERLGFSGCISFDCLGAGQRVIQEVFGGRSWRDDPALLPDITRAFTIMRQVHEALLLLREAAKLALPEAERGALERLLTDLAPSGGWTLEALAAVEQDQTPKRVRAFLASLKTYVAAQR
ncbi:hypothetical protein [Phenylobacterium sp.]|uniref:hypothetical protein n=1 Tax=Phenylobacterium sp. TaxID=1871053 RepID=UPI0035B4CA96